MVELTSILSGYTDKDGKERLGLIDKLIKCSTSHYEDYSPYPDGEGCDLYLDYWVTDATQRAFQFHFSERVEGSEEVVPSEIRLKSVPWPPNAPSH